MQVLVKIYEITFKDENYNLKNAYNKATNWYGKNILKDEALSKTCVKYELSKSTGEVTVKLFSVYDFEEEKKRHCAMCREMHTKVFVNSFFNCNACNMIAVNKKVRDRLKTIQQWYKEVLMKKGIL